MYKKYRVEAAHRLTHVPPDHKCARLHGHSFKIEVRVSGAVGEESGWLMDFAEITAAISPIIDCLDHSYLNEIEGLENPTSENLCIWIWARLKPTLPGLSEVRISETCTAGCIYTGSG